MGVEGLEEEEEVQYFVKLAVEIKLAYELLEKVVIFVWMLVVTMKYWSCVPVESLSVSPQLSLLGSNDQSLSLF